MEQEIDRYIRAVAAARWSLNWSVVVKTELSQKAKLYIYWSIYTPTLTYGHEHTRWIVSLACECLRIPLEELANMAG